MNLLKSIFRGRVNAIDPITASALIAGGSQLLGSGIKGIGAGMSAGRLAEEERRKREQEMLFRDKQFSQQSEMDDRSAGQSGIQMMLQMQDQAKRNARMKSFKNSLFKTLGG